MKDVIKDIKKKIVPVLKQYDVVKAALFGSYVYGNYKKSSDIDLLVKFKKNNHITLLDLVEIQLNLKRLLKRKIDLVTYNALSPYIKNDVLKNMKVIYEK